MKKTLTLVLSFLLLALSASAAPRSLLVLLDETYATTHSNVLGWWKTAVNSESNYVVTITNRARVERWDSTNRLAQAESDFELVKAMNPSAVMVMGNIAMIGHDNVNLDGHGACTIWSWLHLSGLVTNWSQYTDTNAFAINGSSWMTNGVGDGRFDTYKPNGSATHLRIPFAVNFGNLFTNTQIYSTNVWGTNLFSGDWVFPQADDSSLFGRWLLQNWRYRTGSPFLAAYPQSNIVHGTLWDDVGMTNGFEPTVKGVSDTLSYGFKWNTLYSTLAGQRCSWFYWNAEPYLYPYLAPPGSDFVPACIVLVQYKSGGPYMSGGWVRDFLRHPLPPSTGPIAFCSVWSSSSVKWFPYGPTVLESAEQSLSATSTALPVYGQWFGDPSLPLPHLVP